MTTRWFTIGLGVAFLPALLITVCSAATVMLKNGVLLEGSTQQVAGIGDDPLTDSGGNGGARPVVFVDDGIRRVFFPESQLQNVNAEGGQVLEEIAIRQPVATSSPRIGGVGMIFGAQPFDRFGRRVVTLNTAGGRRDLVQGISKITPRYCQVEGLRGKNSVTWDMRIATSSIPRAQLSAILQQRFRDSGIDGKLATIRLLTAADRYSEALAELESAVEQHPEEKQRLEKLRQLLLASKSDQLIREINLRQEAGQHGHALSYLQQFQNDGTEETRQRVRELQAEYQSRKQQIETIKKQLPQLLADIPEDDREKLKSICEEISNELNFNNRSRLADYIRLAGDQPADQKLALIVSGWLLGSGSADENLSKASSLPQVRELILKYLRSKTNEVDQRRQLLEDIAALEGGDPPTVAKIVALIRPPSEANLIARLGKQFAPPNGAANDEGSEDSTNDKENAARIPGYFTFTKATDGVDYEIQLPPEYDSHRRYPTVVTLSAGWSTPTNQIEWWAGRFDKQAGIRKGQASRNGYIVIAPKWHRDRQRHYEYSKDEHSAVIKSLRHATKRFSIDSDRVFLSGHSMGGDAAWDIGLAHPDLWAGIVPIVAQHSGPSSSSPKYVTNYWPNAKLVPMYFVCGQHDGDKLIRNGGVFKRYVTKNYDLMVAEYRGRGHDHFQDDIQNIFQWMGRHERDALPKEYEVVSMRPWDNFFWSLEMTGFPPISMASHVVWPKRIAPAKIELRITQANSIFIKTGGSSKASLWLSPEQIPLGEKVSVTVNNRAQRPRPTIESSVGDLLEDVRTRGDRQHPFWAKIDLTTGRR